ncbi:MAG TPA: phosphatase PAP2 family protein [Polyangiaceae bacterium]|nr:phosphatase PAP2 family protein [Polyangiaceae bacterium]
MSTGAADGSPASRRPRLSALARDARRLDLAVFDAITQTPTPSLDESMRQLTQAADYSRLWLASAVILATTRGARGRRAALTGLASVAVSSAVVNLLIKPLSGRRRPGRDDVAVARQAPMPTSTSFPSGHSASAFAFATGVGAVLPLEAVPIRALAAAVSYSRVHTGVHYPADAIAGAFVGTTLAQATAKVLRRRR